MSGLTSLDQEELRQDVQLLRSRSFMWEKFKDRALHELHQARSLSDYQHSLHYLAHNLVRLTPELNATLSDELTEIPFPHDDMKLLEVVCLFYLWELLFYQCRVEKI